MFAFQLVAGRAARGGQGALGPGAAEAAEAAAAPDGAHQASRGSAADPDARRRLRRQGPGACAEPLEDFFEQEERLAWLREKVREAGGDPKTVDAEVQQLLAEKAQREADALSLVLPGRGHGHGPAHGARRR